MPFAVIALLCLASIEPQSCTRANAIDVIRFPEAANELTCMADAQATLAGLSIHTDATTYWKISCVRVGRADVG